MKTTLKSMIAKVMTAGLLAGVFMLGGAKKAEAQVAIGVQIGRPVVYPGYPVYGRPYPGYYRNDDYYARMRWEAARRAEWERQQAWIRHEQWKRSRYYGRPYGGYGYYGR
jgi:hypothetical protein